MRDKHREKLDRRLTPMDLYKLTPKTNCGKCGRPTCLAFATQVIVGKDSIDSCPYLAGDAVKSFRERLAEQHAAGIGLRRESFEKTLEFLRAEIRKQPLEALAEGLGATCVPSGPEPALRLVYFGEPITVTPDDVKRDSGQTLNPWEKILIFNYVIGGAAEASGIWVGMEKLPNSISKIKSLKAHCEDRLAEAFAGKFDRLPQAVGHWGRALTLTEQAVDFAAEFPILPRLSIRTLWWDADPAEGFPPRTKFLFDSRVTRVLDLESLLFTCEQLTDRLLEGTD